MSKPLLIIKTGSTLAELYAIKGDFEDWFMAGLGDSRPVQVINVTQGATLPEANRFAGAVITGSHCMVTEHLPWSEAAARWLAQAVGDGMPVLGICYGHQLLAYALGGAVGDNPRGSEYGTTTVELLPSVKNDPLFSHLKGDFLAQVCHKQTVLHLPSEAVLLATSRQDGCQAFVFGDHAWGVQFHPEFDAESMRFYIRRYRQALVDEGQDADELLAQVRETPVSAALLGKFARLSFLS